MRLFNIQFKFLSVLAVATTFLLATGWTGCENRLKRHHKNAGQGGSGEALGPEGKPLSEFGPTHNHADLPGPPVHQPNIGANNGGGNANNNGGGGANNFAPQNVGNLNLVNNNVAFGWDDFEIAFNKLPDDRRHLAEVKLLDNKIVDVDDFIEKAKPRGWGDHKKRIANRLAQIDVIEGFFALNPTYHQVWTFLRQNGGFRSQSERELALMIKARAVDTPISGAEYVQIMGQVFQDAFNEDPFNIMPEANDYIEVNAMLIISSAEGFVGIPAVGNNRIFNKTFRDIEQVKGFIKDVKMPADPLYNQRRLQIITALDAHAAAKKDFQRNPIIPGLRAKILAKFDEKYPNIKHNPELFGQDGIKFFHLRDPGTWGVNNNALINEDFECLFCADDIVKDTHDPHAHNGYECPYGGAKICDKCLKNSILMKINDPAHPSTVIECPFIGHKHELPVTREYIANVLGNNKDKIFWREATNLAGYAKALGLKFVTCDCGNIFFESEVHDPNHHVKCWCETEFCYKCKEAGKLRAHKAVTCAEKTYDGGFGPDNNSDRPCPYCWAPIFRIDGCNRIYCSNKACNGGFHWIYGKFRVGVNFEQAHWGGAEPGGKADVAPNRLYRLPGEEGYVPGGESAFPGNAPVMTLEQSRGAP